MAFILLLFLKISEGRADVRVSLGQGDIPTALGVTMHRPWDPSASFAPRF